MFTKINPEEGNETTVSCQWTGRPDPVVTWYKDGSPLVERYLPFRMRITENRKGDIFYSNMEIHQVELSDSGDYTCNVSNPVGFDTRFNKLKVLSLEKGATPTARSKDEGVSERGKNYFKLNAKFLIKTFKKQWNLQLDYLLDFQFWDFSY